MASRNPCSYTPGGELNFELGANALWHSADPETCDPWIVVEADPRVIAIEITPYSNWTDAPGRPVKLSAGGEIVIFDPVDLERSETRVIVSGEDSSLSDVWLTRLSPITRFNRFTTRDIDDVMGALPEGEQFRLEHYLDDPKLRCWWQVYDGGGVNLKVTFDDGREREVSLNSGCGSPAMDRAIDVSWDVRNAVYETLSFEGEHFNDEVATF